MGKIKEDSAVEMVTIPKYEYEELLDALEFLQCLEACGVDSWDGYDTAADMYESID